MGNIGVKRNPQEEVIIGEASAEAALSRLEERGGRAASVARLRVVTGMRQSWSDITPINKGLEWRYPNSVGL